MYTYIVLRSGHIIKVDSGTKITFSEGWSNYFTGELYDSTGKILITGSDKMRYRQEDAVCYSN